MVSRTTIQRANGFTAVELIVATTILALLVTATVLYVRRQKQQELQADASLLPSFVFNIDFRPEKPSFADGETVTFIAEVHNPTPFPLNFKWYHWYLVFDTPSPTFPTIARSAHEAAPVVHVQSNDETWIAIDNPAGRWHSDRIRDNEVLVFRLEAPSILYNYVSLENGPSTVDVSLYLAQEWRPGTREPVRTPALTTSFTMSPNEEPES
jgi:prepilin-type N-terminal cleavage/methylation domain-containing protein